MCYVNRCGYNRSLSLTSKFLECCVSGHLFLCNQLFVSLSESFPNVAGSHSFQFREPLVTFGLQVTALTLLKEEDFPSLGYLLDREFRPLSHLLVLLGWTHCQSLESAKRLLQTLYRTQVSHSAPHSPPETDTRGFGRTPNSVS